MDATVNELEHTKVNSFPTIKLFKKGTNQVIEYNGERTLEGLDKFLATGGEYGRAAPDQVFTFFDFLLMIFFLSFFFLSLFLSLHDVLYFTLLLLLSFDCCTTPKLLATCICHFMLHQVVDFNGERTLEGLSQFIDSHGELGASPKLEVST